MGASKTAKIFKGGIIKIQTTRTIATKTVIQIGQLMMRDITEGKQPSNNQDYKFYERSWSRNDGEDRKRPI